ncbi:MAG: restriction endonuclease subunit S [Victivallaceae bacterium]|nr:restriction endonuclease subunit S [Victivallaceae bacterium]
MRFNRKKINELALNVTDGEHATVIDDALGEYYLLSNKNIKDSRVVFDDSDRKISLDSFKKINKRTKLENHDVVIATVGSIGRTAIIREDKLCYDFQRSVGIIKTNKNKLIPEYLHYYFQLPFVQKRLLNLSSGAVQKCLFISDLKNIDIDVPECFETQKSIAKVLSDLDAKIELNNRINRELEAMAKTLYDYWFVQFDFPFDFAQGKPNVPGVVAERSRGYKSSGGKMVYNAELKREIPEGWEVKTLAKVTAVSNESVNPMLNPDQEFKHYSIPTYDSTKTYGIEKGIDIRSNKFVVAESDILVSKLNPWFSRVIYPIKEDDLICSTEFVVWRTSNTNIKNYLFMVAKGEHFISHCSQSATGTSNSHKRVNPTVMMRYKVPFNSEVIQKFGATINSWIKIGINKQIENKQLIELRDWLLPMLMNGQVVSTGSTTVKEAEESLSSSAERSRSMAAEPSVEYKKG